MQLTYTGARHLDQGHTEIAEKTWRRAVQLDPNCVTAWSLLTDLYEKAGREEEAVKALNRWIACGEKTGQNLLALGNRSCTLKQFEQGKALVRQALQLDPSLKIPVGLVIAKAENLQGNWEAAVLELNEILQAEPDNTIALEIRCHCWFQLGWIPESVADHRRCLAAQPDALRHSRLVLMLNYLAESTPEQTYEESVRWSNIYAEPLAGEIVAHPNVPDPERRLKIGYLSPDLRNHAIMKLLPAVFEKYDRENFQVFAYSVNTKGDNVTDYVKRTIGDFVDLPVSRKAIAERVRADGIDILVDLAGHTMHADALLAYAMKPAPVQVTWLGFLATTGMRTMDYFIGDAYMPHPGTEHCFSEKVYRLPRAPGAYRPPGDPGLGLPPVFKNGYITFGCFNDPRKITHDAVKLWSILLHLHRDAKLFLKYKSLDREIAQRRIRGWFADYGISMERIVFEGSSLPLEYLSRYSQIDIALDPIPYTGGTTTLDALWMGVPVVTLAGRLPAASCGASLLAAAGLPFANTPEEYLALANQLVKTMPASPNIRHEIRKAMMKSPLMDEVGLIRAVEAAYRDMWRTWCKEKTATADEKRIA